MAKNSYLAMSVECENVTTRKKVGVKLFKIIIFFY